MRLIEIGDWNVFESRCHFTPVIYIIHFQYLWFMLNLGLNTRGNPGIFQVTKSVKHVKCITPGEKNRYCFINFFKVLRHSEFKHVRNHSRKYWDWTAESFLLTATSVIYIRRSLGEGALQTTNYSHMQIY